MLASKLFTICACLGAITGALATVSMKVHILTTGVGGRGVVSMNQNGQTLCTDEETWFNLFQDTYSFHCGPKWRLEIRGSDFRVRQRTCGCADLRFQMIDDSSNIYEIYMRGGTYSVVNGGGPGGGGAPAPKTENVWFWTNTKYYNLQSGTPVDLGSYSGPCNPGNCDAGTM